MERKLTGELVRKFGKTSQGCPRFSEIMQIRDFLFSASSFGRDHSFNVNFMERRPELDISGEKP